MFPIKFPNKTLAVIFWVTIILLIILTLSRIIFVLLPLLFLCFILYFCMSKEKQQEFRNEVRRIWRKMVG